MSATRPLRIVTRAVIVIAAGMLLYAGWLMQREPPEIERSRDIRLGMTQLEAQTVMGESETFSYILSNGEAGLRFGAAANRRVRLKSRLKQWLGFSPGVKSSDWPVRVRFDRNWRVDRIERGGEVEEWPRQ